MRVGGKPTAGVIKDVVMLGGFQEIEFDFVADHPGDTAAYFHVATSPLGRILGLPEVPEEEIDGRSIADVAALPIGECAAVLDGLTLSGRDRAIGDDAGQRVRETTDGPGAPTPGHRLRCRAWHSA